MWTFLLEHRVVSCERAKVFRMFVSMSLISTSVGSELKENFSTGLMPSVL